MDGDVLQERAAPIGLRDRVGLLHQQRVGGVEHRVGALVSTGHQGQVDQRTGVATITGSYICTAGASFDGLVAVSQGAGRRAVEGEGALVGVCAGTTRPWSAEVMPAGGKFDRGKVRATAVASACGVECVGALVEQKVKLRNSR